MIDYSEKIVIFCQCKALRKKDIGLKNLEVNKKSFFRKDGCRGNKRVLTSLSKGTCFYLGSPNTESYESVFV